MRRLLKLALQKPELAAALLLALLVVLFPGPLGRRVS